MVRLRLIVLGIEDVGEVSQSCMQRFVNVHPMQTRHQDQNRHQGTILCEAGVVELLSIPALASESNVTLISKYE